MNRIERPMKGGGTIAVTGEGIQDSDVLIAELLLEVAKERGGGPLEMTPAVMDEIIKRARARGYDAVTGEWLH